MEVHPRARGVRAATRVIARLKGLPLLDRSPKDQSSTSLSREAHRVRTSARPRQRPFAWAPLISACQDRLIKEGGVGVSILGGHGPLHWLRRTRSDMSVDPRSTEKQGGVQCA